MPPEAEASSPISREPCGKYPGPSFAAADSPPLPARRARSGRVTGAPASEPGLGPPAPPWFTLAVAHPEIRSRVNGSSPEPFMRASLVAPTPETEAPRITKPPRRELLPSPCPNDDSRSSASRLRRPRPATTLGGREPALPPCTRHATVASRSGLRNTDGVSKARYLNKGRYKHATFFSGCMESRGRPSK